MQATPSPRQDLVVIDHEKVREAREKARHDQALAEVKRLVGQANDGTAPRARAEAALKLVEALANAPASIKRAAKQAGLRTHLEGAAADVDPIFQHEAQRLFSQIDDLVMEAVEPVQGFVSGGGRSSRPRGLLGARGWVQAMRAELLELRLEPAPVVDVDAVHELRLAAGAPSTRATLDLGEDGRVTLDGEVPVHGSQSTPLATSKVTRGAPGRMLRYLVAMSLRSRQLQTSDRTRLTKEERARATAPSSLRDFLQRSSANELAFAQPVDLGPRLEAFAREHRLI